MIDIDSYLQPFQTPVPSPLLSGVTPNILNDALARKQNGLVKPLRDELQLLKSTHPAGMTAAQYGIWTKEVGDLEDKINTTIQESDSEAAHLKNANLSIPLELTTIEDLRQSLDNILKGGEKRARPRLEALLQREKLAEQYLQQQQNNIVSNAQKHQNDQALRRQDQTAEWAKVIDILRKEQAPSILPMEDRIAWSDTLKEALYHQGCQDQQVTPEPAQALVGPQRPDTPDPTKVVERAIDLPKFALPDVIMLVGGVGFGSSLGAAVGGISFDSKGWHFQIIFWLFLLLGTAISYGIGQFLFPELALRERYDTVNTRPYLDPDDTEFKNERAAVRREALTAILVRSAILLLFMITDYGGWYRAAVEHNAATFGDDGATNINPFLAGLPVCGTTLFAAAIKMAVINSKVRVIVDRLKKEVENSTLKYKDNLETFNQQHQVLASWKNQDAKRQDIRDLTTRRHERILSLIEAPISRYYELADEIARVNDSFNEEERKVYDDIDLSHEANQIVKEEKERVSDARAEFNEKVTEVEEQCRRIKDVVNQYGIYPIVMVNAGSASAKP